MILFIAPALACGGMMPKVGQVVASDAQQALLTIDAASISVEYRVRYSGSAQDFAWIIPVPGELQAVEEGDEAQFVELEQVTGPTIWNPDPYDSNQCGCVPGRGYAGGDKGGGSDGAGVTVTGSGFAGNYAYITLTADDPDALMSWLTDNGYDGTLAADDIAAYVAEGSSWVAVQVAPDAAELDADVIFTPLRVTYGPDPDGTLRATYPARMARSSTADTDRIELYVLADSLVDMGGGWTAITPNPIEITTESAATDAYTEELERIGSDKRAFGWIWSGDYDGRFLTRYDTIVLPETQVVDPELTETGLTWSESTEITVHDEDTGPSVGWIGFVGLGLLRRRYWMGPSRRPSTN